MSLKRARNSEADITHIKGNALQDFVMTRSGEEGYELAKDFNEAGALPEIK